MTDSLLHLARNLSLTSEEDVVVRIGEDSTRLITGRSNLCLVGTLLTRRPFNVDAMKSSPIDVPQYGPGLRMDNFRSKGIHRSGSMDGGGANRHSSGAPTGEVADRNRDRNRDRQGYVGEKLLPMITGVIHGDDLHVATNKGSSISSPIHPPFELSIRQEIKEDGCNRLNPSYGKVGLSVLQPNLGELNKVMGSVAQLDPKSPIVILEDAVSPTGGSQVVTKKWKRAARHNMGLKTAGPFDTGSKRALAEKVLPGGPPSDETSSAALGKHTHRIYRFEAMWLQNANCKQVVTENWGPSSSANVQGLVSNISRVSSSLRRWDRNVFGCGLSLAEAEEERTLQCEIDELLERESIFWEQCARANWLKDGDRNTSFFYSKATQRHKKKKIDGIVDSYGIWQAEHSVMEDNFVTYFQELFSAGVGLTMDSVLQLVQRRVSVRSAVNLSRPFSTLERREDEEGGREMQQRKPTIGNGRPSGTDGSDFSYRMVVDSRYTKVAKGKSRLSALIFIQAIVQLVGLLNFLLSIPKEESLDMLAVSSIVISFLSLLIGELGRRRSRVNFLKFFMFASSIAILISIACAARSNVLVEVIQDTSQWEVNKFELVRIAGAPLLGLLVQIFAISTTISLIQNMSPSKRAS
ncbi:hypothetical protein LOK49_LG01G01321 [Camellia lanceoleosa]|uniref:Uncharacterized protein n=1 Tax=Camellia lanceoleosa TaxID=1840588 RepID=A0ACC0J0W3_9ERIC|nr:hypothetical protein LOK49_LG01G01321 [Camellia lanceoleosa]